MADEPRPTLGELFQKANGDGGMLCPHCGCGHLPATWTKQGDGGRRRKRACRNCGREFIALERIVEILPSSSGPEQIPDTSIDDIST